LISRGARTGQPMVLSQKSDGFGKESD